MNNSKLPDLTRDVLSILVLHLLCEFALQVNWHSPETPVGAAMGTHHAKDLANQIKLREELAKKLGERDYLSADLLERTGGGARAEWFEGAELRALRKLLDEVDPQHHWGGLKKVLTPEGHWLWLCEEHAREYK